MPSPEGTPGPTTLPLGGALRAAIDGLRTAALVVKRDLDTFRPPAPLHRLEEAAREVSSPKALKLPVATQDALILWRTAKETNRIEALSRRELRQLVWIPEAVFDRQFHGLVDRTWAGTALSGRVLQALVHSYHKKWLPEREDKPTAGWLRKLLNGDIRDSNLIRKWKQEPAVILGPGGPDALSRKILEEDRPLSEVALQWGIDERTPFFEAAVVEGAIPGALAAQTQRALRLSQLCTRFLPWAKTSLELVRFKAMIGTVILNPRFAAPGPDQDAVKAFVLGSQGLGDPRLAGNRARWTGVSEEARTHVLHWLTTADIKLFFETILPDAKDRHGRKPFWLRYLDTIVTSRPLLTVADRARVSGHFRGREQELQHVGSVVGNTSSAFILLFPNALVVEFADNGRAYCYTDVRRQKLEQAMWRTEPFVGHDLKSPIKGPLMAYASVPHMNGWEYHMEDALAKLGIRPGAYRR